MKTDIWLILNMYHIFGISSTFLIKFGFHFKFNSHYKTAREDLS